MQSQALLLISTLRGHRGRYVIVHAYIIWAPFYCISLKKYMVNNAARGLISRDIALHKHFKFTLFLISNLLYPFIKTLQVSQIRERPLNPLPFSSFPFKILWRTFF